MREKIYTYAICHNTFYVGRSWRELMGGEGGSKRAFPDSPPILIHFRLARLIPETQRIKRATSFSHFFCDCDGKFCSCLSCSWKTESKSVQYNFDEPRAAGKANLQQEKCWECGKWVYNGQDFFSKTGNRFRNPLTKGLVGLPSTNILDTTSSSKWFLKRIKESCRVPFTFMSLWAK